MRTTTRLMISGDRAQTTKGSTSGPVPDIDTDGYGYIPTLDYGFVDTAKRMRAEEQAENRVRRMMLRRKARQKMDTNLPQLGYRFKLDDVFQSIC